MDNYLSEILGPSDIASYFTVWELLIALALSLFLSLCLSTVYRITHRGVSYSQSFVHTIILVGVTVSVIMLIIGSNIARAFTLVGALSIIRFRVAIKDPRDVAFIFAVMAAGMACGTRFYGTALIFTFVLMSILYLLHRLDAFARHTPQRILRVQVPANLDYEQAFDELFYEFFESFNTLSLESVRQGAFLEIVYVVSLRSGASSRDLLAKIRAINGNAKVVLTESEGVNI